MAPSPEELPEGWEEWLALLAAQLPQPLDVREDDDRSLTFTGGEPAEVVVRLTPTLIRVAEFAVRQRGPRARAVAPRWLATVRWRRMPVADAIPIVEALIRTARSLRRATFRTCEACERTLPPEEMQDERICHACSRLKSDVVQ